MTFFGKENRAVTRSQKGSTLWALEQAIQNCLAVQEKKPKLSLQSLKIQVIKPVLSYSLNLLCEFSEESPSFKACCSMHEWRSLWQERLRKEMAKVGENSQFIPDYNAPFSSLCGLYRFQTMLAQSNRQTVCFMR